MAQVAEWLKNQKFKITVFVNDKFINVLWSTFLKV
jgi:hypothetical protein